MAPLATARGVRPGAVPASRIPRTYSWGRGAEGERARARAPPPSALRDLLALGEMAAAAGARADGSSRVAGKGGAVRATGNGGASLSAPTDTLVSSDGMQNPSAPAGTGFPEILNGTGKSAEVLVKSLIRIAGAQGLAAATRVTEETAAEVRALEARVQYDSVAKMLVLRGDLHRVRKLPGTVALVVAGTAVPSVVEECRLLLQCLGCYSFLLAESGVMGMHRLVENLEAVRSADVVLCVTGSDPSIASLTAGLVDTPVIVLPTSSGYGAALGGIAPLLGALNAAAPGLATVNIDSGFGAAMAAWRILRNAAKVREAVIKATQK